MLYIYIYIYIYILHKKNIHIRGVKHQYIRYHLQISRIYTHPVLKPFPTSPETCEEVLTRLNGRLAADSVGYWFCFLILFQLLCMYGGSSLRMMHQQIFRIFKRSANTRAKRLRGGSHTSVIPNLAFATCRSVPQSCTSCTSGKNDVCA
jgi:hypothetical protein